MKFEPANCIDYTFEQLSNQYEKQYDYLWFNTDSAMHCHKDLFHFSIMAKESFFEKFLSDHPILKGLFKKQNFLSYEIKGGIG